MIDVEKVAEVIKEKKEYWDAYPDSYLLHQYEEGCIEPFIAALGNDENEIKRFISNISNEDLLCITNLFEYIYEKFLNDDMYDFLDEMEIKAGIHD